MRFGLVTCRRNHAQPLAPSHDAITTLSPLCHHAVTLSPHYHTPSHHLTNRLSARVRARPWLYCTVPASHCTNHFTESQFEPWGGRAMGRARRSGMGCEVCFAAEVLLCLCSCFVHVVGFHRLFAFPFGAWFFALVGTTGPSLWDRLWV